MKPPIQIVDTDDRLIGHKLRGTLDYQTDIYRVAALWLTNTTGDILLAQRKHTKDRDPGLWGPAVAGTLDEGETYTTNIYKEAEEELGINDVTFQLGPKQRVYAPRNYFCQWFTVRLDRPAASFILQEEEVEAVRWLTAAELAADVQAHPQRYIPAMPHILKLLTDG